MRYLYDDIDFVVNYPCTSPRVVIKNETVNYAPYIDLNTRTWWQYDTGQNKYIDTQLSSNIGEDDLKTMLQSVLPELNISLLNNDANYARTEEDIPLTLDEVREILQLDSETSGGEISSSAVSEADVLAIVRRLLSAAGVSSFVNDANYATSDEDVPLTIEELNSILN